MGQRVDAQRQAIRLGGPDFGHLRGTATAGRVLDNNRLADCGFQRLGQGTDENVGRAAGLGVHHHLDRAGGPCVLRVKCRGRYGHQASGSRRAQRMFE